ncbi:hypothetical protein J010_05855 [Cryptococcus neoformans]|nr:hypothetical protein C355_05798 [Cryptococcus neoformans var. grubii Th84]OXH02992.1 hypothetical protein J010_05855 [Cryptococcus neoformans var. grubii]OXH24747.1 hypothetical protein J009_05845 [Cryptococcus neoformans var. grubii]OXH44778.1 hypothetical protein J004_05894 [Cryptococcus neoformans var. grubii]OXH45580.1 hypothetical protein J003_05792 [Cryptococcus neoformans var. grubii]
MSAKPIVRRTYGKAPPRASSPLFDPSSPPPALSSTYRSSSPSSYRLDSPLGSSPPPSIRTRDKSPLFLPSEDDDDVDERDASQPESSTAAALLGKGNQKAKGDPIMEKKQVQSSLKGFFTSLPMKRPLEPSMTVSAVKPKQPKVLSLSRPVTIASFLKAPQPSNSKTSGSVKAKTRSMTQMHLTHLPLLHTCPTCGMSFVRGGPDEGVHVTHHTRVLRGILWEGMKKGEGEGWKVVQEDVEFGGKRRGRIIVVDGSFGGSKLVEILSTVDRVLSAPPLPPAILDRCKIFVFLTHSPPPPPSSSKRMKLDPTDNKLGKNKDKERVVSVVVAQGIKWAMKVLKEGEMETEKSKTIETGGFGSVTCDPTPLPTPLGIHRLYTTPSYRSHSLSSRLLDVACEHTVYGCTFDPKKGEVAFSQPTESGRGVMERWGGGEVRVFVDDQSQL